MLHYALYSQFVVCLQANAPNWSGSVSDMCTVAESEAVSGAAANAPPALHLYTTCMLSNMMRSWQLLKCADVSFGSLCVVARAAKAAWFG
jgi:hypothetical protein